MSYFFPKMVKSIRLCLVRDMFKMHASTVKQVFTIRLMSIFDML